MFSQLFYSTIRTQLLYSESRQSVRRVSRATAESLTVKCVNVLPQYVTGPRWQQYKKAKKSILEVSSLKYTTIITCCDRNRSLCYFMMLASFRNIHACTWHHTLFLTHCTHLHTHNTHASFDIPPQTYHFLFAQSLAWHMLNHYPGTCSIHSLAYAAATVPEF